ncbi:MAG: arsenate reductase (glutaredoxin) [Candidatus Melainabacteria bacterium]|nr:arsenate reductase (glutaredoxin) [Candidatus Melainabacteria bacterium]
MANYTVLHNPRCGKSRKAIALLEEQGQKPAVREYLEDSLNAKEVKDLLAIAKFSVKDLVRPKEAKEFGVDPKDSDANLIKAIAQYPKIMQRPVVIKGKQAVIARDEGWFDEF